MIRDSATMLRRNFRHVIRYPSVSLLVVTVPVILLLLFVYVFGGRFAGLGPVADGRAAYLDYVVPGILLIAVAGGLQGTAISVAMDMTEGIIARFRTMGSPAPPCRSATSSAARSRPWPAWRSWSGSPS